MVYTFESDTIPSPVRISVRVGSSALAVGDAAGFSFDAEGRLLTATVDDVVHKRGLNHRFVRKEHRDGRRHTAVVDSDHRDYIISKTVTQLGAVLAVLPLDAPPDVRTRLEEARHWDVPRYREEVARFESVYSPVGILPPDQYMSLVVQATEGCHYNGCTFCEFYREIPFHVKDKSSFQAHVRQVKQLIGRATAMRRSLFLADANALVTSFSRLLDVFEVLGQEFVFAPEELAGRELASWLKAHPYGKTGVYSFMDAFTGQIRPDSEFAELQKRHLRRVYIGMESGHIPLLEFLKKPSMPDQIHDAVSRVREGGVNVGVIVMTGIGGSRFVEGHIRDTVGVLNRLPLREGDLLYLSPFREDPHSEYARIAEEIGLRPLSRDEGERQARAIRAGLALPEGVKVSIYDVDEFVY